MHELSIATAVVESADAAARRHGAASVDSVCLRVGELAGVVPDALRFSFDLAAAGTALEGARLEIEDVPARARCATCPGDFAVGSPPSLVCPRCAGAAVELVSGRELELAAVRLPLGATP
ncbi:hydrogenase maturation nickel metallochaperone HypA [Streptomyces sp. TRM70308]|uniref:hydrogenase maturation nickel metallochaperone HypA n=1 Tax=Streptomyces TaxID=1883 RepID=UPI0022496FC1|nr:hydrogenase maturation nickel metallochaperone HypA [Streptomyces sp. JHD 1]MCX2969198.1 hydrogenase maturation nickel metallochaperone HypA [Streptomyces sp. JHD 1]